MLALPLILGISGVLALSGCQAVIPPLTSETSLHTPETLEAQSWRSSLGYAEKREVNSHGRKVLNVAYALMSTDLSLNTTAVARALQPVCLRGAQSLTLMGKTISLKSYTFPSYPTDVTLDLSFSAAPSIVQYCLVRAQGDFDFSVWLLTREGYLSIDGYFPPGDPDIRRPEEQRPAIRAHSSNVYKVAHALLAEDPSASTAEVAASLQPLCKSGATGVVLKGKTYSYTVKAAPITTTTCTVVAQSSDDYIVTVASSLGFTSVNGAEPTP